MGVPAQFKVETSIVVDAQKPLVTSIMPDGDVLNLEAWDADEIALNTLGYKQEFKREFSHWTMFCASFAVLGLLPSFASTLSYSIGFAGTGGMVWGWLIAWFFIQCVALGMAELCSSMPTSGGLSYASATLAPPGWGPIAAWFTGWSNWLAQVSSGPSIDYGIAAMTLAVASIANPDYIPKQYQTFLLTIFLILIHAYLSSMPTLWIARFSSYSSIFGMISLVTVIILIPASVTSDSKFSPSSIVWTIQNSTEWPDGIAILMSFAAMMWTMACLDAPFHLSEECSNASIASPRAIVLAVALGGIFGWLLQLVVAYTVKDIPAIIASDLGQPWASYLIQVLPQKTALAILALTIICGFSMGQANMVAASRVTFAHARDGWFPASWWIRRFNTITLTPVNAVWFNTSISCCLCLLILGGPIEVGAIFSVGAIAAYVAFAIPIFIRVFFAGDRFHYGPWHLGKLGRPIGALGCCFVLIMAPVLCFPSLRGDDLTSRLMNWASIIYSGFMFLIMIWWFISARKWYKGPSFNVEHYINGRPEVVVGGVADQDSGSNILSDRKSEEVEAVQVLTNETLA